MKFYTFPPSPNSLKIAILIEKLSLTVDLHPVDLTKGEHLQPEIKKLNINAKIPILKDGDFVLWESNAILQYLASINNSTLYAKDLKSQVNINRWLFWQAAHWGPAIGILMFENFVKPHVLKQGEPDQVELQKGIERFSTFAQVLDQQLQNNSYVAGNELTIADLSIGAWLTYVDDGKIPLADYPYIEKWHKQLAVLAPWQKAIDQGKAFLRG